MEKELKKAEEALSKEKNLNQKSFYEGYIKGLKFSEKEIQAAYERGKKDGAGKALDQLHSTLKTIEMQLKRPTWSDVYPVLAGVKAFFTH